MSEDKKKEIIEEVGIKQTCRGCGIQNILDRQLSEVYDKAYAEAGEELE